MTDNLNIEKTDLNNEENEEVVEEFVNNNPNLKWYIVHTYSQYEKRVKKVLEDRIEKDGLQEFFGEIAIPTEKVIGAGKDPKRITERKFFPGYILINMELNDTTWSIVKNIPKVTHFVGYRNKPQAVPVQEVERILNKAKEGAEKATKKAEFSVGDMVKVVNGPFINFPGQIDEIKGNKFRVMINIFGRETPVELGPGDIEPSN
jgi:transcriptional antiterminator NusG